MNKEINIGNSVWFLIAESSEPRHIFDLIYAYKILYQIGIDKKKIYLFSDTFFDSNISFSNIFDHTISNIRELENISSSLKLNFQENLFVAVSGHGIEQGFSSFKSLSFINILKQSKAKYCCCIFTQCYAGIFHYIDTQKNKEEINCTKFVVLGSTNLNMSISVLSDNLDLFTPINSEPWSANIFFINVFNWLYITKNNFSHADIDGDNFASLLDCYRYAGVISNKNFEENKSKNILDLLSIYNQIPASINNILASSLSIEEKNFKINILYYNLNSLTNFISLHQEPWILNANLARDLHFNF